MDIKTLTKILTKYDYSDIDIEIWKSLPFKNLKYDYQISNYGRLRNKTTNKIIKPYFTFDRNCNKSRARYSLHTNDGILPVKYSRYRLVAMMFVENDDPVNKIEVDHLDGDKTNDHYSNLEWVTPEENRRRETEMGLRKHKYGEKNASSKWKDVEVEFMCDLIFNKHISNIDELYNTYIEAFESDDKTYKQVKNLYYNITHKTKPKWVQISSKYKK